mgnify:CR=1 FL=1
MAALFSWLKSFGTCWLDKSVFRYIVCKDRNAWTSWDFFLRVVGISHVPKRGPSALSGAHQKFIVGEKSTLVTVWAFSLTIKINDYLATLKSVSATNSSSLVSLSQTAKVGWPVLVPDNSPGLARSVPFGRVSTDFWWLSPKNTAW